MSAEKPFNIAIPEDQLALLQAKLDLATFPDELDDAGWRYGVPLANMKRLVAHWKDGYNWRKHEANINDELPQFTRDVEVLGHGTLNIHYVHRRSDVIDAIPLLFVHGWPGSFLEVRKLLPLLTKASLDHPSFHVVAPSLPGYGFSQAPSKKGFRLGQYAEICNKLMLALGYNEYVTQGGDLGFFITREIAKDYGGRNSRAWHTNYPICKPPTLYSSPLQFLTQLFTPYTAWERAALVRSRQFEELGRGYFYEQSTKPQTLGYGVADSPIGLLAWIYEKLVSWTDSYQWDDDEILTWISLYQFSRAGPAASFRIYYEITRNNERFSPPSEAPSIPLGVSLFPKELVGFPTSWIRTVGNLVSISHHEMGGHFAAYEQPEALVGGVRKMFEKGGPAFGVVPGKTGYA